jgi:F-type H+-transporting ATPase subunit epsilon
MNFSLRVFAVDREIFAGEAKSLTVPSATGQLQILAEHAPLISILKEGEIIIEDANGGIQKLPIMGGTVEVTDTEVVALVNF